jgi:flagellar protein FliS
MASSAHDAYLESKILTADPIELTRVLYRTALDSVREARQHLAQGDIAARSQAVSRAVEILSELNGCLNHEIGGEVSQNLARLYDYLQRRLLQANFEQAEAPLVEVVGLLSTLLEAWQQVKVKAAAQPDDPYTVDMIQFGVEDAAMPDLNASV